MKVTVGSGDRGRTSLLSGERVMKNDARVEACGAVDELNAVAGALGASLSTELKDIRGELEDIQEQLLRVGACLSATPGSPAASRVELVPPGKTAELERSMDRMEREMPSLQGFVLPGGHPSAAWAHVARTVCRRAERRVLALVPQGEAEAASYYTASLSYLNRLSDYLFVVARFCNFREGIRDRLWRK